MKRHATDCRHRIGSGTNSNDDASCGLVQKLLGGRTLGSTVSIQQCQACCDSFNPTETDWNPVIASLVYQIGDSVRSSGGTAECDVVTAQQLCDRALEQLPVVLPEEDDCVDDLQNFQPPRNVGLSRFKQVLPVPQNGGGFVGSWAVGVTTAPRRQPTLANCLDSLSDSGWKRVEVFVDGETDVPEEYRPLIRARRSQSLGAWPAWIETVRSLLEYECDAIMVVQDDTLFPKIEVLREYLESVLWPDGKPCLVSLYTCTDDMRSDNQWLQYPGRWQYGALAVVLHPRLARQIVQAADRDELNVVAGTAGIDSRIGVWAQRNQIPIWHPCPSLVQHIGQVSSVWERSRSVGLRRADRFVADEF